MAWTDQDAKDKAAKMSRVYRERDNIILDPESVKRLQMIDHPFIFGLTMLDYLEYRKHGLDGLERAVNASKAALQRFEEMIAITNGLVDELIREENS